MTNPNKTLLVMILDRSGSMESIKTDMEGGLTSFIADQKKQPGKCLVTLVQFDDQYDVVFSNKPIAEVGHISLVPRGWTALLDAMGRTINTVGAELAVLPEHERPGQVLVLVITDGQENKSEEFTTDAVRKLVINQQENYQWTFTFLGANQDAVLVGRNLGVPMAASMDFVASAAGVSNTWDNVSTHTNSLRGGAGYGSYSDAERKRSMANGPSDGWKQMSGSVPEKPKTIPVKKASGRK